MTEQEIKFDLIYKGDHAFHHKKYYLCELMIGINKICDIHSFMDLVAKRQYVGRKDNNGVEIYERDILLDENKLLWVVDFYNGFFRARNPKDELDFVLLDDYDFQIIGNVYENPELLKD